MTAPLEDPSHWSASPHHADSGGQGWKTCENTLTDRRRDGVDGGRRLLEPVLLSLPHKEESLAACGLCVVADVGWMRGAVRCRLAA